MRPLRKLLVIDDDEDTLTIVKYSLQSVAGLEVKCVLSGDKGIEEANRFQPDLILLDVMMPKMDGVATLKILSQSKATAGIPAIFFTAKVQRDEISAYLKMGVVDVIIKPFDPIMLGSLIQNIWAKVA